MKHFFKVNVEENDYSLLFHAPSSKISKVQNIDNNFLDEDLYAKLPHLNKEYHAIEKRSLGKGKIGITFMSARKCNMSCRYCFAGEGEYGSKENKPDYLSLETYMKVIEKAVELYPEGIKSISFFGGEPLLNHDTIKMFIPDCISFLKSKNLSIPGLSIITNGILLDEKKLEFFKEFNVLVGLSLDGPKKFNDYGRLLKGKKDSVYDIVVEKIELLRKYEIGTVIQFTLNRRHLEDYQEGDFKKWIDSLPVLDSINVAYIPVETEEETLRIDGKDALNKLDKLAREITNYYIDELYKEEPKKIATGIYATLIQIAKNKYQNSCSAGHSILADTDGCLYPCHMYCNDDDFLLGNTLEGWVDSNKINMNANVNRMDSSNCKSCIAQTVCAYWCKGISYLVKSDQLSVLDARCTFQKACVEECIKALVRAKDDTKYYNRFINNLKAINHKQRKILEDDGDGGDV